MNLLLFHPDVNTSGPSVNSNRSLFISSWFTSFELCQIVTNIYMITYYNCVKYNHSKKRENGKIVFL